MAASPLAFALMSCNTIFPHMTLVPPELPSLHWCPECVSVGKSLCMGPLKGRLGFQSLFVSLRLPESALIFIVRVLGNYSSLGWDPGLGTPYMRLGPSSPSGEPPQLHSTSRSSTTMCGCGLELHIFSPPTGFDVAPSYHDQLDFRWFSMLIIL